MKTLIFFLFVFSLYSCSPTEPAQEEEPIIDNNSFDTKAFYYPTEDLAAGKVYEYVMVHEEEAFLSHYWHLQSEKDEKGNVFLIWKRYDAQLQQDQYIKEWVVDGGVITQEYKFLVLDSATQEIKEYPNHVSQNVVFPFEASLDSVMAYRFVCEMKLPPDFLTAKLVRDRKFAKTLSYSYKGDSLEAVAFACTDLYDIENKEEGGFWQMKKAVIEVYAKGIGLVYQEEKTAGQEGSEVTRLNKIYSVEEFEKRRGMVLLEKNK